MNRSFKLLLGVVALAVSVMSCGTPAATYCCDSGYYFNCPSAELIDECFAGHTDGCTRDATKDSVCQSQ